MDVLPRHSALLLFIVGVKMAVAIHLAIVHAAVRHTLAICGVMIYFFYFGIVNMIYNQDLY